jgi:hypothetical protein
MIDKEKEIKEEASRERRKIVRTGLGEAFEKSNSKLQAVFNESRRVRRSDLEYKALINDLLRSEGEVIHKWAKGERK